MRKKLSIILGLAAFFIIVPLVNAQVGDQNGIPPTDAIIGFFIGSENVTASNYKDYITLIEGTNITIDVNHADSELTFNSVGGGGAPASIHLIGNVTNSGCAEDEILIVNSTGYFVCGTAAGGSGETNTASNLNEGYGIFAQKNGVDLEFKSLLNGSGIVITQNSTNIMFNSTSTRDQMHWINNQFSWDENNIWLLFDQVYNPSPIGSIDDYEVPVTKPLYIDYMEIYFASNTIPVGTWDMRILEGAGGTNISGTKTIDLSTISGGDTVRIEFDTYVPGGSLIMIDGECTGGTACTSGSVRFSATLEFYAVNDAMDFPGWEFQDDNLGNHTATQNLNMNGHSIQNANFYETDGTVASVGELRMSFGDLIAWRNSLGTDDLYIETVGLDVFSFQINTENVATLSNAALDLKGNNLELGAGRVGFDDLDTAIQQDSSDLDLRTGGSVIIDVSGTNEYTFSSTQADFNTNVLKGSLGCADEQRIEYNSSTDVWDCVGAGGGGADHTLGFSVYPSIAAAKGANTWVSMGSGHATTLNTDHRFYMSADGTADYLQCHVTASGTNAGSSIFFDVNGFTSGLTVAYAAGVTGKATDSSNSVAFSQGDWVVIQILNNSSGGGSKDLDVQTCTVRIIYD